MDIFIGNLPLSISALELRRLFGEAGSQARFRLFQKRYPDGAVCCYGRAKIDHAPLAGEIIEQLRDRQLSGRRLEVRRFVERSPLNERRAPMWRGIPWVGLDRRKTERRNGG